MVRSILDRFGFQIGDFQYTRGPEPLLPFKQGIADVNRLDTDRHKHRVILSEFGGCIVRETRSGTRAVEFLDIGNSPYNPRPCGT